MRTLAGIEGEIRRIKQKLLRIGEMRPGSLTSQYHYFPNDKKYKYYQVSYTHNAKSHTEYVKSELVEDAKKQIRNYRTFKLLMKRWVDLAIQHARLKDKPKVDLAVKKK